jgi:hypothetical protein
MMACAKMDVQLHAFLTSAPDADATIKTARFPRSGRLFGPQSQSGRFGEKRKISCLFLPFFVVRAVTGSSLYRNAA